MLRLAERAIPAGNFSYDIIQKLKGDAENYLGEKLRKRSLRFRHNFNDAQRQATKDAGVTVYPDVKRAFK